MSETDMPSIAVIADAHFHDVHADFGLSANEAGLSLRRLADTVKSLRVFNESARALNHALEDIARRGIKHVVLLGDYSDDGQVATLDRLSRLLSDFELRFGMRFYAVAGNHDIFAAQGRHRSKRFLCEGGDYVLSTSDPAVSDVNARRTVVTPAMYCHGYPAGLQPMQRNGFFRRGDEILWETPFGDSDNPLSRVYEANSSQGEVTHQLMDASYLVEPLPGLWMLMIDANVFVPLGPCDADTNAETFADSTDAGWNAIPEQKPFILKWMKEVAVRAEQSGKHLLTFSHYPALDPLRNTSESEKMLTGETMLSKRIPGAAVAEAFLEAGIKVHFSGHLHINDTALYENARGFVVNVGVPSLVAYPAAYKIVSLSGDKLEIETVSIGECGFDPVVTQSYRHEIEETGLPAERLMRARSYGEFLYEHLGHLVSRRYLRREWPPELAELVRALTLADVAAIALQTGAAAEPDPADFSDTTMRKPEFNADMTARLKLLTGTEPEYLATIPLLTFLEDWYRLKMAGGLALRDIPVERKQAYDAVMRLFDRGADMVKPDGLKAQLAMLFAIYEKYDGLPSENFSVCLQTGKISVRRPEADALAS
ncbi:putative phosphohydrolase [Hoeflea phototrophica DFL-43]|uniref:Putative phosphohydrolase n=1 Tax=Hoeflea phototrophica (strain DSM 17068 / NCIMB 14078 / DFL-43) TaxID=411684 RepID=A9DAV4_HOEPD|nr:metallophosphoesterase [Hoeflea phototrophica]EDQ32646.2 putative phosphohydrolase [Hoeflea phototrophica DFL-43]